MRTITVLCVIEIEQIMKYPSEILKIKIALGYILLASLFALIVYLVYKERKAINDLDTKEEALQEGRKITDKIFIALLDLSSSGELLSIWSDGNFSLYKQKRIEIDNLLYTLKSYYPDPLQSTRIDTISLLLQTKESIMANMMETLQTNATNDILHKKIPAFVKRVQKQQIENPEEKIPLQENKKGFWRFLKKNKKSAYSEVKREASRQSSDKTSKDLSFSLLHSIENEISEEQQEKQEQLRLYADSLEAGNRILNRKINGLIHSFTQEAFMESKMKTAEINAKRECSFHLVSAIAILAFVLVILLYTFIHNDINKRIRYRKKLELSVRKNKELLLARNNMMLAITHDLRAPLGAISGYAELIPEQQDKQHKDEYAKHILTSSAHMLHLINNLLNFYRLDEGKEQLNLSSFHLRSFLNSIALDFRPLAEKKGLNFISDYSGESVIVSADRSRIYEIIGNLLSNAIKFTTLGEVRLTVSYAKDILTIAVSDTGFGMSEEDKTRIFHAFERLGNAGAEDGFGLGLAITSRLVALMKGTIAVESQVGKGSTFTVRLPLTTIHEDLPEPEQVSIVNDSRLHVLLIDDDRLQLDMTENMLIRNGIRCDCCGTTKELITNLKEKKYDLLITDIQMPGTNGFDILKLLRSSNIIQAKTIPVLAVTARADRNEQSFVASGFAGCLYKPFSMHELVAIVSKYADRKSESRLEEPDFSMLLTGERNQWEMLDLFVRETENNKAILQQALNDKDPEKIAAVVHRALPVWIMVGIDMPLSQLQALTRLTPNNQPDDASFITVRNLIEAIAWLSEKATEFRNKKMT